MIALRVVLLVLLVSKAVALVLRDAALVSIAAYMIVDTLS